VSGFKSIPGQNRQFASCFRWLMPILKNLTGH
jgi:hypothetical protein